MVSNPSQVVVSKQRMEVGNREEISMLEGDPPKILDVWVQEGREKVAQKMGSVQWPRPSPFLNCHSAATAAIIRGWAGGNLQKMTVDC